MGAETLLLIAAGASAVSSIGAGVAAKKQADFQADVARQQAGRERQVAAASAEDFRRRHSQVLAQRRADLGGAGIRPSTGTPLLASSDFASEAELQRLRILAGGETNATRLEQQAQLFEAGGRTARTAGIFRGGASLLTGLGEFGGIPRFRGSSARFGRVPFAPGTGPSGRI